MMPADAIAIQHEAALHVTDDFIVDRAAAFFAEGLRAGERVLALATASRWAAISGELERRGFALGRLTAEGRAVLIEAEALLETITVAGIVDAVAFGDTLQPLLSTGGRCRIYGEVVSLLTARGDLDGALRLERLGHELAHAGRVRILCGYEVGAVPVSTSGIARIRSVHDHTVVEGRRLPAAEDRHAVRFYRDAASLSRMVAGFVAEGLGMGVPAIVIGTPPHRAAIQRALDEAGVDTASHPDSVVIFADAEDLLDSFLIEGVPDGTRFRDAVTPLLERACRAASSRTVRAYGEMVDVLWTRGQKDAAILLEQMWNQLAQTHDFTLLCGYAMGHFYKCAAPRQLLDLHSHVSSDALAGMDLQ